MTPLVNALKEVGQTFDLFQKGELGPCHSTPSPVQVPNLVPSSYCRVPATVPGGGSPVEPVVIDPKDPELQIAPTDEKVDVRAKFALKRMLNDPSMAVDAARLILGLKGKRLDRTPGKSLAGIFGDDLGVAVKVARDHNTERWLLVPKGEDSALVLVNESPGKDPLNDPPTVIFRGDTPDISKQPGRLEKALQEASQTFELFQDDRLGLCASSPSAKPVANLVPSSYCQLSGYDFVVIVTEEGTQPPRPVSRAAVRVVGFSPSGEFTTRFTDETGQARFSDLASGSYQVTASKEGFEEASTQVIHPIDKVQTDSLVGDSTLNAPGSVLMQLKPSTDSRLRLSIWAGANKFFPTIPQTELKTIQNNASGNVDDISLLWQIKNAVEKKNKEYVLKDEVRMGPSSLVGAKDMSQMKTGWKDLVNACHRNKIQLLAGFKYVKMEYGWIQFNNWLDAKNPDPPIDKFAQTLVDFVINELPGCNGISFDIEAVYVPMGKTAFYTRRGEHLKEFYRSVALKLKKLNPDLIVDIAVGAKSSDIRAASRKFDDPGQTVFDYRVVFENDMNKKPIPNIVLRPMGYVLGNLDEPKLYKAHEDTIKYALNTVGVPPQQFQLGVSCDPKVLNSISYPQIKKRCELCRKYKVGLVIFAWSCQSKHWKDIDNALNPNFASRAGQSKDQPFQVPITDLIKAFKVIP